MKTKQSYIAFLFTFYVNKLKDHLFPKKRWDYNKPSWDTAPSWAKYLAIKTRGKVHEWFWYEDYPDPGKYFIEYKFKWMGTSAYAADYHDGCGNTITARPLDYGGNKLDHITYYASVVTSSTNELISVCILGDDNSRYYVICSDYDYSKLDRFTRNDIVPALATDLKLKYPIGNHVSISNFHKFNGKSRYVIFREIAEFVRHDISTELVMSTLFCPNSPNNKHGEFLEAFFEETTRLNNYGSNADGTICGGYPVLTSIFTPRTHAMWLKKFTAWHYQLNY